MKLAWLFLGLLLSVRAFAGTCTDDIAKINQMVGDRKWFTSGQLVEDAPFKGTRGKVSFITSGKKLKVKTSVKGIPITASAVACQNGPKSFTVRLSALLGTATVQVTEVAPNRVRLVDVEHDQNNTYTAQ